MKILASDFDNTLYFHTGFKAEDLQAIKTFQAAGHKFGVCTGRSYNGIVAPSTNVDIHYDFYICLSGGLILNEDGEVLFEKQFPYAIVKEIYARYPVNVSVVYGNAMYLLNDKNNHFKQSIKALYKKMKNQPKENIRFIDQLDDLKAQQIPSFSFHYRRGEHAQAVNLATYINKTYGDYVNAYVNDIHIDVCAKGCSKGHALKQIGDYYHINKEDLCGIGDNFNDLPLLQAAYDSFTFAYAPKAVQKQAKHIVPQLSEAIDELLF